MYLAKLLEHMHLTCCVVPQGKALNVRVKSRMKCVLNLTLTNLRMRFEQIAFAHKRIAPQG